MLIIFFESVFIVIPIVLLILLNLIVFVRKEWVFALAFFSGLFLDFLGMRQLGGTSLFLIIFLFVVILYEKKFETTSIYFISIISFFGSLSFLTIFYKFSILESLLATLISAVIFVIFEKFLYKKSVIDYRRANG